MSKTEDSNTQESIEVNATQTVTVELKSDDVLTFIVTRDAYSKFIDEASLPSGKVAAMQNFLMRTANSDAKQFIKPLTGNPLNITTLAGAVLEQYTPDIEIAVK